MWERAGESEEGVSAGSGGVFLEGGLQLLTGPLYGQDFHSMAA